MYLEIMYCANLSQIEQLSAHQMRISLCPDILTKCVKSASDWLIVVPRLLAMALWTIQMQKKAMTEAALLGNS